MARPHGAVTPVADTKPDGIWTALPLPNGDLDGELAGGVATLGPAASASIVLS